MGLQDAADNAQNSGQTQAVSEEKEPILEDKITWMFWKKRRYVVVLMAFLGFFNVYSLRVNLSVAIVAMTEKKNITLENGTVVEHQDFPWTSSEQGLVLSSFFYGYIFTQLIGGYLGSKFGGHYVFASGIGVTALLTLVTPIAARHSLTMLLAVRIVEGLFEGVTFPCIHAVWARWAPVYERSRMATLAFAGNYAGTVIAMPVSGLLAASLGWDSVFYFFGAIGCVWAIAWMFIVKGGPEVDPYISEEEKIYILKSLGQKENKTIKHPWKAILTSTAVWAIIASHFAENWGFFTLLTQLPTFLKETLNFELEKTGFISAIPYLAMGCLLAVSGYLADWSQVKGYLTTAQVRRYFNCGAFLAQTIFMMLAAYLLDPVGTVACITVAVGFGAFAWSGFIVNPLDLAPNHASVILGISNTFATIPGIVSPLLTGIITSDKTKEQWQIVFYISSGIYLVGCVIYWFFCKGELQPWAVTNETLDSSDEVEARVKKGVVNEQFDMSSEEKKDDWYRDKYTPAIHDPEPILPNVIPIAGMHMQEMKPLPPDFQKVLDSATNSLIFFSLGTNVKSWMLGEEIIQKFVEAFRQLPQYTILWKFDTDKIPNMPKNVIIKNWVPQNDILSHPNAKLFMSHCGLLSSLEATWQGVPVLAVPIFLDQNTNAAELIRAGLSESINIRKFTPEEVKNLILKMMTSNKYHKNSETIDHVSSEINRSHR
ncbi:hypothetical protein DMENIID0001_155920 [Sergentomyia squamirostris]